MSYLLKFGGFRSVFGVQIPEAQEVAVWMSKGKKHSVMQRKSGTVTYSFDGKKPLNWFTRAKFIPQKKHNLKINGEMGNHVSLNFWGL